MHHSNIDQWISEFPKQRKYILLNQRLFALIRPPQNITIGEEQWRQATVSLRQPDEN